VEELVAGLWRAMGTTAEQCRAALLDDWAPAALESAATLSLTVNTAVADQGAYTVAPDAHGLVPNADAMIVIGLERAHELDDFPARDALHSVARRFEVWRVITHNRKEFANDTPLGAATPGVKLVAFVRRAEDLTHEQFVRHWAERHAPLALAHHVGMCGYTQHVVRRPFTPGGRHTDGIAELHFPSRADFDERFYDSDAGRAAIRADTARFIRREESSAALMEELRLRV
jgi:uncharacterized protein (TIGR02118 family)